MEFSLNYGVIKISVRFCFFVFYVKFGALFVSTLLAEKTEFSNLWKQSSRTSTNDRKFVATSLLLLVLFVHFTGWHFRAS